MANNKYDVIIRDKYNPEQYITVDVYQVLDAYGVRNSALSHLVKKALCTGVRGYKNVLEDCKDIVDSAVRAEQLELQRQYIAVANKEDHDKFMEQVQYPEE
ncbi:hypothetical protein [Vibrio phage VP41s3]|nr:hypothetical protein [Vibrio phage VP41s3]